MTSLIHSITSIFTRNIYNSNYELDISGGSLLPLLPPKCIDLELVYSNDLWTQINRSHNLQRELTLHNSIYDCLFEISIAVNENNKNYESRACMILSLLSKWYLLIYGAVHQYNLSIITLIMATITIHINEK